MKRTLAGVFRRRHGLAARDARQIGDDALNFVEFSPR
jgi:hypothetical protein